MDLKKTKFILCGFMLMCAGGASASGLIIENDNSSQIINQVESRTETGGNTVINGQEAQGQSKSEVRIKTYVDGHLIEDIDKTNTSTGNSSIDIKNKIESKNGRAKSRTEIKINDGPTVKTEKEVPIKSTLPPTGEKDNSDERVYGTGTESRPDTSDNGTTSFERAATKTKDMVVSFWKNFFASLINFFKFK